MLRALGWDTEDPALAMPEYRLGSGFADYALLNGGKPAIVIDPRSWARVVQRSGAKRHILCQ